MHENASKIYQVKCMESMESRKACSLLASDVSKHEKHGMRVAGASSFEAWEAWAVPPGRCRAINPRSMNPQSMGKSGMLGGPWLYKYYIVIQMTSTVL